MNLPKDAVLWFEIPVSDFDRAKKFYSFIYDYDMPEHTMGPNRMGIFLMDQEKGGVGGAILQAEGYTPSKNGTRIYLQGGEDLSKVLNKVEPAGGKVIVPKTFISEELGYYATFEDTEGNYLSLYSLK